jgi:hypothetical protein
MITVSPGSIAGAPKSRRVEINARYQCPKNSVDRDRGWAHPVRALFIIRNMPTAVHQFYVDFPNGGLLGNPTRRELHDVKPRATAELGDKLLALQSRSKCSVG